MVHTIAMSKKLTQPEIILQVLEAENRWVYGYELIKRSFNGHWLGSSADRAARKMAEADQIERDHEGKYAKYRVKQEQLSMF